LIGSISVWRYWQLEVNVEQSEIAESHGQLPELRATTFELIVTTDMRTPKGSTKSIVWQESSTWFELVGVFLDTRLRRGAASVWKGRGNLDSLYADDPEWHAMLEPFLVQGFDQTAAEFADDLADFDAEVFHACRPLDVAGYLTEGLATATWAEREERLCRLIRELEVKHEDAERLLKAFQEEMSVPDIDIGALFLALDRRHLLEFCGHYLILGSEWVASRLGSSYYPGLRRLGIPTLLRIRLPLAWASLGDRKALARELLCEWTRLTALEESSVRDIDITFRLTRSIPSAAIISHSHPSNIPDPHHPDGWGQIWKNPTTRCLHCT
jgi:hypothetical protein